MIIKNNFKLERKTNKRYVSLVGILAALIVLFTIITDNFMSFSNMMNIVRQTSILAIVSVGMTFVILTGNIDLSIPNTIALSGVLASLILKSGANNAALAIIVTVLASVIIGCINGFLVGYCGLNAFIATLAMNTVLGGISVYLTDGKGVSIENNLFLDFGRADVGGVPVPLFFVVIIYVVFLFVNLKTVFGRHIYAVGGNKHAAQAIGINSNKLLIYVYAMSGFLVGIASVLNTGRLGSAQPYAGTGMDFNAITAVVLGGTSLMGGLGGLGGTIIGSILIGVLTNGLDMMQSISQYYIFIIKGILILVTVGMDLLIHERNEKLLTPKVAVENEVHDDDANLKAVMEATKKRVLQMTGISKAYPGMMALDDVSLKIESGEVVALVGENGAGKSTLMQILLGENQKSAGTIRINNCYVNIDSPRKAEHLGIAMIHQENALVQALSVSENMFLGREIRSKIPVFINRLLMRRECAAALKKVNLNISPNDLIKDLTVSQQQLVEIARALKSNAWLLVMDEPTSSLTDEEKDMLFDLIRQLKKENKAIIYISHRMQEIYEIADKVVVLRDGKEIDAVPISAVPEEKLIQLMVGRKLSNVFDREKNEVGEVVMKLENLSKDNMFHDINLEVRSGEVLGLSGLIGSGRTELMKSVFGFYAWDSGTMYLNGKVTTPKSIRHAMDLGFAYLTEDRKYEGFVPYMSIKDNLAMPSYDVIGKGGVVNADKAKALANDMIKKLDIRTTSMEKNVIELSGGNQQKIVLGKWLSRDLKVLILDEPTRGVDIGSKAEIHKIIAQIAKSGVAIVLISSEMPELIGCADRIAVMREGRISGIVDAAATNQNELMKLAVM